MILPRFIRKILAILRGGVSPVLIFLSVMLGFWFGLVPGFSGFHAVVVILMLILNVHVGLFLLSAGIGKTLCFAAAPLLYHVGLGVQSYLSPLLRLLSSIPILGMTDFTRYSVAGAIVLGPIIGAIGALLMARSVISFRRMMLKLEEGSEKFKKWYSNRWVRILDRLLVGKRTKDAKALFTGKTKLIRKAGAVLAVLVLAGLVVAATLVKDNAIKTYAAQTLTKANGAEVNLEELGLSALTGSIQACGIEVTDPQEPQNNQVSIEKIAADASLYNLLLGKLVMENVEVSDVKFGQQRSTPGKVVEAGSEQEPAIFDPCDSNLDPTDMAKLETYLKDAKALKEKLQKLRKWLPKSKDKEPVRPGRTEPEVPQKYLDYLQARAVVPASPRLLAKRTLLDKVQLPSALFGNSEVLLTNISDAPQAAGLPITFELKSHETGASLNITIDYSLQGQTPKLSGAFEGFDLSKLQSSLGDSAGLMFESGLASGQFEGTATSEFIDLTIDVDINGLGAKGQGNGVLGLGSDTTSQALDALRQLKTTIRVVGPITEPRLLFDVDGLTEEFKQALVTAGKKRLADEIDKRLGEQIDQKLGDEVPDEIKDILKKPEDLIRGLGGLLGGDKKKQD